MSIDRWLHVVPLRLRSLFFRAQDERELDEEIRYHVERQIEDYVARGLTPEEARRAALRAFGGVEQRKEECRDMRRVNLVRDMLQDLRYAARLLRRSPVFSVTAVLTLGFTSGSAIGAPRSRTSRPIIRRRRCSSPRTAMPGR